MVVSGTTGHLLRCTKNVSTAKFSVLSSKYMYGHKSNVNFQNVVVLPRLTTLYCNCRRFHYTDYFENSRESRSTFTKLSPQEVLLANVDQIRSFETNPDRYENSVDLEEIAKKISDSFNRKFSQENVRSVVNKITDKIDRSLGSADILDVAVNLFLENNEKRFRDLEQKMQEYGTDIEALVKLINSVIGRDVLQIVNSTILIDANTISNICQKLFAKLVTYEFPDNLFLQLSLTKLAQDQIHKALPTLESFFDQTKVQVRDVQKLMAATSVARSPRSKREIDIIGTIVDAVRAVVVPILSPIQQIINDFFDTVSGFFISLYVPDEPENQVLKFLSNILNTVTLRGAEIVITMQDFVNGVFNNILYGNGTSTAASTESTTTLTTPLTNDAEARKIDVSDSLFKLELRNGIQLRETTNVTETSDDSLFSGIAQFFSSIGPTINTFLKTIFQNVLSSSYVVIGQLVTYPLRYVVEKVVDFIFNCGDNCTSIL